MSEDPYAPPAAELVDSSTPRDSGVWTYPLRLKRISAALGGTYELRDAKDRLLWRARRGFLRSTAKLWGCLEGKSLMLELRPRSWNDVGYAVREAQSQTARGSFLPLPREGILQSLAPAWIATSTDPEGEWRSGVVIWDAGGPVLRRLRSTKARPTLAAGADLFDLEDAQVRRIARKTLFRAHAKVARGAPFLRVLRHASGVAVVERLENERLEDSPTHEAEIMAHQAILFAYTAFGRHY